MTSSPVCHHDNFIGVLVTELSSNAEISAWQTVWVTANWSVYSASWAHEVKFIIIIIIIIIIM